MREQQEMSEQLRCSVVVAWYHIHTNGIPAYEGFPKVEVRLIWALFRDGHDLKRLI